MEVWNTVSRAMLAKGMRARLWIVVSLMFNGFLLGYVYSYTDGGGTGRFIAGLPEAFVVFVVFVFGVTAFNTVFSWYYLGKPPVSELFTPESPVSEQQPAAEGGD